MNIDLSRMTPKERVRLLTRRGEFRNAMWTGVDLGEMEGARMAAWYLVKAGHAWRCDYVDDASGEWRPALPLYTGHLREPRTERTPTLLNIAIETRRWVSIDGCRVPALWGDIRARIFACACAETVLSAFEADAPGETRPREAIALAREMVAAEQSFDCEDVVVWREILAGVSDAFGISSVVEAALHALETHAWSAAVLSVSSASSAAAESASRGIPRGPGDRIIPMDAPPTPRGIAFDRGWSDHATNVLTPLMLRHMLLPIEELTRFEEEGA